jgi:hypothetical protein
MSQSLKTAVVASFASFALLLATATGALAADANLTGVQAIDAFIKSKSISKESPNWKTKLPRPPKVKFDPSKKYFWQLETNVGTMKVKLMPDVAPMHVSSTIYLTELGFYDDTIFHRVIPGFMAQAATRSVAEPAGPATSTPASSTPRRSTTGPASSAWPIPDRAPTAASSS